MSYSHAFSRVSALDTDGICPRNDDGISFDTCFVTVEPSVTADLYLEGTDSLDKLTCVTVQCSDGWSEQLSLAPSKISGYIKARLGDGWSLKGSFITSGEYTVHVYSTIALQ